jgi:4-hydroxybenzoate polyprenyltransferase
MLIWRKLKTTLEMIKFEHTLFALPFAFIGALLARNGLPTARETIWIVIAMVGARSSAMAFNRMADLHYDTMNPRTAGRALPKGTLSIRFVALFTVVMSSLFVFAASQLNPICFYLSIPVLGILFAYSYTKRFTSFSHLVLGLAVGLAPLAAWLALRGGFAWPPVVLSAAVMFWVAGFDVIYALQDAEFDRNTNLFSLPVRFGVGPALRISSLFHCATIGLLLATALLSGSGWMAYAGIVMVAVILYWEHHIVKPHDLSRINVAFFNLNGYISVLLLLTFAGDILTR